MLATNIYLIFLGGDLYMWRENYGYLTLQDKYQYETQGGRVVANTDWTSIDTYRKGHLAVAELVDAWRVVPRLMVGAYSYLVYITVKWYMALEPKMIEGCVSEVVTNCIYQAPTTQHAALVTAVVGVSAAVFGLYTNSGRKWNGFTNWNGGTRKKDETQAHS